MLMLAVLKEYCQLRAEPKGVKHLDTSQKYIKTGCTEEKNKKDNWLSRVHVITTNFRIASTTLRDLPIPRGNVSGDEKQGQKWASLFKGSSCFKVEQSTVQLKRMISMNRYFFFSADLMYSTRCLIMQLHVCKGARCMFIVTHTPLWRSRIPCTSIANMFSNTSDTANTYYKYQYQPRNHGTGVVVTRQYRLLHIYINIQ